MMIMTTIVTNAPTPKAEDKQGKAEIVLVDFGEPQAAQQVKRLRKGRGKLMTRIERVVSDLVADGTVKSGAQAVVVVVREQPSMPWPSFGNFGNFGNLGQGDDDEDDDDIRVVRVK
jgi:hypothetical protein